VLKNIISKHFDTVFSYVYLRNTDFNIVLVVIIYPIMFNISPLLVNQTSVNP